MAVRLPVGSGIGVVVGRVEHVTGPGRVDRRVRYVDDDVDSPQSVRRRRCPRRPQPPRSSSLPRASLTRDLPREAALAQEDHRASSPESGLVALTGTVPLSRISTVMSCSAPPRRRRRRSRCRRRRRSADEPDVPPSSSCHVTRAEVRDRRALGVDRDRGGVRPRKPGIEPHDESRRRVRGPPMDRLCPRTTVSRHHSSGPETVWIRRPLPKGVIAAITWTSVVNQICRRRRKEALAATCSPCRLPLTVNLFFDRHSRERCRWLHIGRHRWHLGRR